MERIDKVIQEQTWVVAKLQALQMGDKELKIYTRNAEDVLQFLLGVRDSQSNTERR